jgi:hypothetical protein
MSPSPQLIASTNELGVAGRATEGSDETLVNVARSPCRSRRKPSGDRVAGLLAVRPGVLIRRVEPQVVPALPWIPGGTAYSGAVRYRRAAPSRVAEPFAVLIARYERLFMHPGRPVMTLRVTGWAARWNSSYRRRA